MAVQIRVLGADRVRVDEDLAFDLGPVRLRQLVRRIRLAPRALGRPQTAVKVLAVTDAQGAAWPVRIRQWDDELEIRIGSGESFLTGRQSVHLAYEVDHAILPGRAREQLSWDVTGGPWDVPIIECRVTVILPAGGAPERIDAGSELGRPGEATRAADFRTIDAEQVRFSLLRGIDRREAFRVYVSWPAELTPPIGPGQKIGRWLRARPWWLAPLAALGLVIAAAWRRAQARRRARFATTPITALAPAELGFLAHGELGAGDVAGTALDLARRGQLRIVPTPDPDGYRLEAAGAGSAVETPAAARESDHPWRAIFPLARDHSGPEPRAEDPTRSSVSAAELAPRTVRALAEIETEIARGLARAGYLAAPGWRVSGRRWLGRFIAAGALSLLLAALAGAHFPAAWPGVVAASGLAATLPLAIDRRRRTTRGEEAAAWARAWVARAAAAGESLDPLERAVWLPTAVALGVGAKWLIGPTGRASSGGQERPSYWPPLASGDGVPDARQLLHELVLFCAPFQLACAALGREREGVWRRRRS